MNAPGTTLDTMGTNPHTTSVAGTSQASARRWSFTTSVAMQARMQVRKSFAPAAAPWPWRGRGRGRNRCLQLPFNMLAHGQVPDGTETVVLNLASEEECEQVCALLHRAHGALSLPPLPPPPRSRAIEMRERWRHGLLDNFSYLLYLNDAAGRSMHDLAQYPFCS